MGVSQNNLFAQASGLIHVKQFKQCHLAMCLATLLVAGLSATTYANAKNEVALNVHASLPAITVYAERQNDQAESIATISRDNLDKTGVSDMADVVKYLPLVNAPFSVYGGGTYIDSAGTSSYNIRGVDANRIGLDIDGVDLAEASISPYMPPASMSTRGTGRDYVEPEMLNAVDIVSGTTNASTDGIGGRVSFKNKSPHDYLTADKSLYGAYKAGYSSADQAWLNAVTGAVGNDTVKALVAYAHRDGHETDGNSKTKAFKTDWNLDAVLANLSWNVNEQHQLNLVFDRYQKKADTLGMDGSAFIAFKTDTATQNQEIERNTVSLEDIYTPAEFVLFDRLTSKAWLQESRSDTRTIYDTGSYIRDFFNGYTQKTAGLKLDAQKELNQQKLKYGLAFDRKEYSSDRHEVRSNGKTPPFTGTYLADAETSRYAAYVSDQFNFEPNGKALSITPSLRVEHQQYKPDDSDAKVKAKDFTYFAPGLSIAYQMTPENFSYFKYSRGARVPSAMEMGGSYETSNGASYLVMGNSDLKKETSDAFELGLKNTAFKGLKFDITAFYTAYNDFIDYFDHGSSVDGYWSLYRAENIADAKIWGAELSAHLDLGQFIPHSDGFSLALVAGKSRGTAKNKEGQKTGMNSVQPEKGSLTFAYDDPNKAFGLGLTATAVGAKTAARDASTFQTATTPNYKKVAGYSVFDLAGYWNINKSTKLNLAVNNIFDKTYWNYASVGTLDADSKASIIDRAAEPGRNIVASVEFKY